jgi:hypothetical protein
MSRILRIFPVSRSEIRQETTQKEAQKISSVASTHKTKQKASIQGQKAWTNRQRATAIISQIPLQWTTHPALAGPGNLCSAGCDWLMGLELMGILASERR